MNSYFYYLIILFSIGCSSDVKKVDIKPYAFPVLGNDEQILYEFEGGNEAVMNLKTQPESESKFKSSEELIGEGEMVNYDGKTFPTIDIRSIDIMEVISPETVYKQVAESTMVSTYGKGIGLMKIFVSFENGLNSTATLKTIHRGDKVDILKSRILRERKIKELLL